MRCKCASLDSRISLSKNLNLAKSTFSGGGYRKKSTHEKESGMCPDMPVFWGGGGRGEGGGEEEGEEEGKEDG